MIQERYLKNIDKAIEVLELIDTSNVAEHDLYGFIAMYLKYYYNALKTKKVVNFKSQISLLQKINRYAYKDVVDILGFSLIKLGKLVDGKKESHLKFSILTLTVAFFTNQYRIVYQTYSGNDPLTQFFAEFNDMKGRYFVQDIDHKIMFFEKALEYCLKTKQILPEKFTLIRSIAVLRRNIFKLKKIKAKQEKEGGHR